jgi:hypothetical protein
VPLSTVSLKAIAAACVAAALCAGSASAEAGSLAIPFQVTVQLKPSTECFGTGDPLSVQCATTGGGVTTVVGSSRGGQGPEAWMLIPPATKTETYGSVYAANVDTRLVRYDRWEYLETTVSW